MKINVYATLFFLAFVVIGSDYLDDQPPIGTATIRTSFLSNLVGDIMTRIQEATKYRRITLNILYDPLLMPDCTITIVVRNEKVIMTTTKAGSTTDEVEEPSPQSAASIVQEQPSLHVPTPSSESQIKATPVNVARPVIQPTPTAPLHTYSAKASKASKEVYALNHARPYKTVKPFKDFKALKPEPAYKNFATFYADKHTAVVKLSPQSAAPSEEKQPELQAPTPPSESQVGSKRVSVYRPTIEPSACLAIYKPCKGLYELTYERFDEIIKTAKKLYALEFKRLHKLAIKHYATLQAVSDKYVAVTKSALQSASQLNVSELYQTSKAATFKTCKELYEPISKSLSSTIKTIKHLYALESERLYKMAMEQYATFLGDDYVPNVKPTDTATPPSDAQTEEEPTTSFSTIQ
jgi:hypothetical protein